MNRIKRMLPCLFFVALGCTTEAPDAGAVGGALGSTIKPGAAAAPPSPQTPAPDAGKDLVNPRDPAELRNFELQRKPVLPKPPKPPKELPRQLPPMPLDG